MPSENLSNEPRLGGLAFHKLVTRQRLRHTDCDDQGHVNNAVMAELFDDGRVEMLFPSIWEHVPDGSIFALATQRIDYHAELNYPGEVAVGTTVLALGSSSVTVGQGLFDNAGACVATDISVTVLLDPDHRPIGWPAAARTAFAAYCR
jgi:acyl-CoA thioester hydrolase